MTLPVPWTQEEEARVLDALLEREIQVEGRLVDASNVVLLGTLDLDGVSTRVIYKPVKGERRLWDFPDETLAQREAFAFALSSFGGWNLVPPTVLREGPFGLGSVQLWVDAVEEGGKALVDVVTLEELAPGWLPVFGAKLPDGTEMAVANPNGPADHTPAWFVGAT